MKRMLIVLALAAPCAAAEVPAGVLTSNGWGPIKIGSTVFDVGKTIRDKLPYSEVANHGCSVLSTKDMEPRGISFVIDRRKLARINVDYYGTDPRPLEIKTDKGVGLGSSEEDVLKAYAGHTRVETNPMDPAWHTIYADGPDSNRAVVFETNGKTVKSIRAGEYPAVSGQDGCD